MKKLLFLTLFLSFITTFSFAESYKVKSYRTNTCSGWTQIPGTITYNASRVTIAIGNRTFFLIKDKKPSDQGYFEESKMYFTRYNCMVYLNDEVYKAHFSELIDNDDNVYLMVLFPDGDFISFLIVE